MIRIRLALFIAALALMLAGVGARLVDPVADRIPGTGLDQVAADASTTPSTPTPSASTTPTPSSGLAAGPRDLSTSPGRQGTSLPRWRTERVLPRGGMLIAYYGSADTGALGVLGETSPDRAHRRLVRASRPFQRPGRPVRLVYELIVSIADPHPGRSGDFHHDIPRAAVQRYIDAARRNDALLLLDIQTGRADFLKVAKRWAWALAEPHVGLALDPEWRMGRHQVPGRVIGSVRAREVNRVSAWLSTMVVRRNLPEKLFVLHQFRTSMLPDINRIVRRDGLRLVQHVDGFGTPGQKIDTYRAVARPRTFAMGFKLFYDEDIALMSARAVHRIRPAVRFVSYQ